MGIITWTDKIIGSTDNGFFRLLDGQRYTQFDGLTTKHMYRFLAMAFEHQDVIIIDARHLATRHLGIMNLPKYFLRLMQTLEPALEQLRRKGVVGSWHVVSKTGWRLAIRSHASYIPEKRALAMAAAIIDPEMRREQCRQLLEKAGMRAAVVATACGTAQEHGDYYSRERAAHLMERLIDDGVMPHLAQSLVRQALEAGTGTESGRDLLDWIEIALNVYLQKRRSQQRMRIGAGLIVKLIRDEGARQPLVVPGQSQTTKDRFRRRERAASQQHEEAEQRRLILEYEEYREVESRHLFDAVNEELRTVLVHQRMVALHRYRSQRLNGPERRAEAEGEVMAEMAKESIDSFERWRSRRMARQAILSRFQPEWTKKEAGART